MNPYSNLPPEQHGVQRLVDQFNADERLWQTLHGQRRLRRKGRHRLSRRKHKALDLLEFAKAKAPSDAVSQPSAP
jgi:hypothetical protein